MPQFPLFLRSTLFTACGLALATPAFAQIKPIEADNPYLRFGETIVTRYQVGAKVFARKGPVQDVLAMVATPFDCPEQDVEIVEQDITQHVESVDYRPLAAFSEGGAQQMLISIPYLPGGEEARAVITYDVATRIILPPEHTESLSIPQKPDRDLKRFLGKSMFIETKHPKLQ